MAGPGADILQLGETNSNLQSQGLLAISKARALGCRRGTAPHPQYDLACFFKEAIRATEYEAPVDSCGNISTNFFFHKVIG